MGGLLKTIIFLIRENNLIREYKALFDYRPHHPHTHSKKKKKKKHKKKASKEKNNDF